jgi:hypothetical protein
LYIIFKPLIESSLSFWKSIYHLAVLLNFSSKETSGPESPWVEFEDGHRSDAHWKENKKQEISV